MTCRKCGGSIEPGAYLPFRHIEPHGRGHYAYPAPPTADVPTADSTAAVGNRRPSGSPAKGGSGIPTAAGRASTRAETAAPAVGGRPASVDALPAVTGASKSN